MKKLQEEIQNIEYKILENKVNEEKNLLLTEMKKIGIEKLPYSYSALKTFIDPETMEFHYNKHYKGYVDKLNDALSKKNYGDLELEKIIKNISRYDKVIRNNAGGAFNHAMFWNMLTPKPKKLTGDLYKKITKEYGTFTNFKKKFETIAKDRFGSGWVWLIITKAGKLKIMSTPNQDNPLMNVVEGGGFPLLGLDLWEHAYYLKYRNKRDEYITNFWKVVNWDFVSKLFEMKSKTKLIESKIGQELLMEGPNNYIHACSKEDDKFFQTLLENNEISKIYGGGIYRALKTVPWLEYKERDITQNRMQGFYKDGMRHDISYLAGNHRAFCMITKSINALLSSLGKPKILLQGKKPEEQVEGIKRLVKILVMGADKIFTEGSPFYKAIMSNLGESRIKGEKVELWSKDRLEKEFGEGNVEIKSLFGAQSDSEGLDGEIKTEGQIYKAQIKPFSTYFIEDEKYVVLTPSSVKKYNVDWMIFSNSFETIVFKNENIEKGINAYKFPIGDLIYTLR